MHKERKWKTNEENERPKATDQIKKKTEKKNDKTW